MRPLIADAKQRQDVANLTDLTVLGGYLLAQKLSFPTNRFFQLERKGAIAL